MDRFHAHHSPFGAWCSLVAGCPGKGCSIDHERNQVEATADLLVAWGEGAGTVQALPFITGAGTVDQETRQMEAAMRHRGDLPNEILARWRVLPPSRVSRRHTPNRDSWEAGPLRFTIHAPLARPPDPAGAAGLEGLRESLLPAVWLEAELDHRAGHREAILFLGLNLLVPGNMRPLGWTEADLAGVGLMDRWCLAALRSDGAFTIRDGAIARAVEDGEGVERLSGSEGGVALRVRPGTTGRLLAVLAWGHQGWATQGVRTRYAFQRWWDVPETAARAALAHAPAALRQGEADDAHWAGTGAAADRLAVLAQAAQAYQANSSLLVDETGEVQYSVSEGGYNWRNTLDLAADHLPYELARHPWVVRLVAEDHHRRNAYRDRIRLPGETGFGHEGGLAFSHDQGSHTVYCPAGGSGYERADVTGCYGFMTLEQVLNAAFVVGAYALTDHVWAKGHRQVLVELVASLVRRDHPDPARRDGILKAESDRVGERGCEITTYDALDHALLHAQGSTYLTVKGWSACRLLGKVLSAVGEAAAAGEAEREAARIGAALLLAAHPEDPDLLPANLLGAIPHAVPAVLDGLGVPAFLGILDDADAALVGRFRRHWRACLRGGGLHARGGLLLSAATDHTWPSKAMLVLHAAESLLGIDLGTEAPLAWPEIRRWCQELSAETTIADQVRLDADRVQGGYYYPRHVSVAAAVLGRLRQGASAEP